MNPAQLAKATTKPRAWPDRRGARGHRTRPTPRTFRRHHWLPHAGRSRRSRPACRRVRARTAHRRQLPKIAELAASLTEVTECHRITGEDCFLIKIHAPTIADLEATLDQFLVYGQTVTSIVVCSPVPPRDIPPDLLVD